MLEDEVVKIINEIESVFFAAKASTFKDAKGIDIEILHLDNRMNKHVVPLQIKSHETYQEVHKEKYPTVPSLVVKQFYSFDKIKKSTERIMDAFINRQEVLHL